MKCDRCKRNANFAVDVKIDRPTEIRSERWCLECVVKNAPGSAFPADAGCE